jgi:hypothetical protein
MAGAALSGEGPEASGAVLLEPRPGSLLEGALWHPDPSTLSGEQALQVLADVVAMRSFLAAVEALAVERVRQACEEEARRVEEARRGAGAGPARFGGDVGRALAVSEVAVAEGIGEFAPARLLTASEALCGPQLAVLDRLEAGVLSEAHARVITDETATLPEAAAGEFGIECLRRLETRTGRRRSPAEFRKAVRALRERLHPESIRSRRARAERDRGVWVKPEPDGMCTLTAFLPAEAGLAAFNRVDALARAHRDADPEEGRTLPQLRADELAAQLLGLADGERGGEEGNRRAGTPLPRAEVVVHIPAATLLGAGEEPAELEGYGLINAETARALAIAAPRWQRLFDGEDGVPLVLGRSAYRPPKSLRRFIEYRDGTCLFPNCSCPAQKSEIDHIAEWQHGGATDAENLQAVCTKHHALKSLGLWQAERLESNLDGSAGNVLWTSPLGNQALTGPTGRDPDPPPS